ncbi:hypothetical protein V6N11_021977 [Hibiscus sabdariffa]|uniref:Uncharacterized protein n=1 Tax=Hibiscus sabdariffa TaxID=183260 RepID=A0ABR2TIE7_9ROSI
MTKRKSDQTTTILHSRLKKKEQMQSRAKERTPLKIMKMRNHGRRHTDNPIMVDKCFSDQLQQGERHPMEHPQIKIYPRKDVCLKLLLHVQPGFCP